jgi:TPR repeat protein
MICAKSNAVSPQGRQRKYVALLCSLTLFLCSGVRAEGLADADEAFDRGEFVTALELYEALSNQQEPAATYRLGLMYEQGLGTDPDPMVAASWYQKAQALESPEAIGALADLHLKGVGVIQDFKEALRLNISAAEAGYAPAQYNLAVAYANGVGTFRDPVKAHMWFNIAAASGYANAAQSRDSLASVMAEAEVTRAQQRAKACMDLNLLGC